MSDSKVVPAQLSFLAIYNPSLGKTDETFEEQIVFWYSKSSKVRRSQRGRSAELQRQLHEEENAKLRQIGLAQGIVDFARSFSNGTPAENVETEKSRIVMHELEAGWWILASIDLTRLPVTPSPASKSAPSTSRNNAQSVEYSSREVSPASLLRQQLIQAHGIFLLHNGPALDYLIARLERAKFCGLLERFWNRFSENWDVLLHGNPAVDIFGGLKLSAGGELGIGVGEEEWGSGEREVLEDFAGRTEGLVDLVVSRFGEPSEVQFSSSKKQASIKVEKEHRRRAAPWMGAGNHAEAVDGIFFSGVGAISRSSLRDISQWTEWIYALGDHAYGVKENPSSDRRKRKRRPQMSEKVAQSGHTKSDANRIPSGVRSPVPVKGVTPPGIPPPIVSAVERSLERATSSHDVRQITQTTNGRSKSPIGETGAWMKYMTLGYGSVWGPTETTPSFRREPSSSSLGDDDVASHEERSMRYVDPDPDVDPEAQFEERLKTQVELEESGHFVIGLKGDMEEQRDEGNETDGPTSAELTERVLLRTLYVELVKKDGSEVQDQGTNYPSPLTNISRSGAIISRLRVVIYVHRPFIYTFLFHPRTESLQLSSFYKSLHTFFAPLHRPLSASTSPARVAARIGAASSSYSTSTPAQLQSTGPEEQQTQPIFDIVYDPRSLSVHASIPNIPIPGTRAAEGLSGQGPEGWSRAEALNVHSAILEIWRSTRREAQGRGERELERSVKTARGWWVVWMRLDDETAKTPKVEDGKDEDTSSGETVRSSSQPTERLANDYFTQSIQSSQEQTTVIEDGREAILVRRARDALPEAKGAARAGGGLWGFGGSSSVGSSGKDTGSGWGPARLAEGVGVDARKYVEGLLSLNR